MTCCSDGRSCCRGSPRDLHRPRSYDIRPWSRTQEVECVSYDIRLYSRTEGVGGVSYDVRPCSRTQGVE